MKTMDYSDCKTVLLGFFLIFFSSPRKIPPQRGQPTRQRAACHFDFGAGRFRQPAVSLPRDRHTTHTLPLLMPWAPSEPASPAEQAAETQALPTVLRGRASADAPGPVAPAGAPGGLLPRRHRSLGATAVALPKAIRLPWADPGAWLGFFFFQQEKAQRREKELLQRGK